jgi:ligand-binding SRPBCC domain-containing protein
MSHVQFQKVIPAPRMEVFRELTDPALVVNQVKPVMKVTWQNPGIELQAEAEFLFLMERFGFDQPVRIRIEKLVTGNSVTYSQVEGFFAQWTHTMKFEDHGQGQTLVTDLIEYEMPFGLIGRLVDDFWWREDLKRILETRLEKATEILAANPSDVAATPNH